MAAITRHSSGDAETYEAVDANLAAGVLVIPSTTATNSGLQGVKVAGDAAPNVLGVSMRSAVTFANQAAAEVGTGSDGYPFVDVAVPDATLAVENHGIFPLTYTAVAVAYGARLCAAASGGVRAWVSGTDLADAIVGWCAEPGGVSSSGGVALVRLNV
jgi:hypothetical protein